MRSDQISNYKWTSSNIHFSIFKMKSTFVSVFALLVSMIYSMPALLGKRQENNSPELIAACDELQADLLQVTTSAEQDPFIQLMVAMGCPPFEVPDIDD
jgi:hypothetical protein